MKNIEVEILKGVVGDVMNTDLRLNLELRGLNVEPCKKKTKDRGKNVMLEL